MKIGYYLKSHGGTIHDAIDFTEEEAPDLENENELRVLVLEACEYAWHNNDGWEWLRSGTIITIVADGKEYGDFRIMVDSVPEFSITRKRPEFSSTRKRK